MRKKVNLEQCAIYFLMLIVIVATVGYTYLTDGIGGEREDLMYHMLRIEAVKEALMAGEYPARVNPIFFNGYGYGSSLFYPDIFLVIPAIMRIVGLSPLVTWKLYVMLLTAICSMTAFWAFRYISKNFYFAVGGTFLLVLSQFYIADIMQRSGLSQYIAYVFIPLLIAGLYDFVAREGKKVYLIGIAFVGMLLSHMIMTVVGILITVIFFMIMLCVPSKRKVILKKEKIISLALTAIVSVLLVAYYAFPMMEQMLNDEFLYMQPWANIGEYTQPFGVFFNSTGQFYYIARVGVGIPILMLIGCRMLFGKPENRWADFFLAGGVLLLVAMTDALPWDALSNSFLNMLQFTYRLYPYALCFIVLGLVLYFSEKCKENSRRALIFIVILAVGFGAWQNRISNSWERYPVNEEYIYANSFWVGKGEWLPKGVAEDVRYEKASGMVEGSFGPEVFEIEGYNKYSFECKVSEKEQYILPLVYYKGYAATLVQENGEKTELSVSRTADGLAAVQVEGGSDGMVYVEYAGTLLQAVSNGISLLTLLSVMGGMIFYIRKNRMQTEKIKSVDK